MSRLTGWLTTIHRKVESLIRGLSEDFWAPRADRGDDRRSLPRYLDGSLTTLESPSGVRGVGRILDVCSTGVRLWSRVPLAMGDHVACAVTFSLRQERLGMRVIWARRGEDGWEYGLEYRPAVPGNEYLMDNYVHAVLGRLSLVNAA